jgi:hypothetical protein
MAPVLAALLLAGCSEGTAVGDDAGPDAAAEAAACDGIFVQEVQARVVDEAGAAVPEARAQLCARLSPDDNLVCLFPETADADGRVTIRPEGANRCLNSAKMRVLLPSSTLTTTYCDVPLPGDPVVEVDADYVLYDSTPATDLPPEGDVVEVRTVSFTDGLEVDVQPQSMFPPGSYASLGARLLEPEAPRPCWDDGSFRAIWAFDPEVNLAFAGAFRAPNPSPEELEAGDEVEILVLGGLDTRTREGFAVEEAAIEPIGTGTISEDGTTVETEVELPVLNWMMLR